MIPRTFILNNDKTRKIDFTTNFSPTINLQEKYEAALISIDLYNSIPNVTTKNNIFKYSTDNGQIWKTITLGIGSYELNQINTEIQRQMIENSDYDEEKNQFYITIEPNLPELKSFIQINNESYRVKMDNENSILSTVGFTIPVNENELILSPGNNKSQNIVDITSVNTVLVHTDFINGSYVNSNESTVIYAFDPNKVAPGFKLNETPNPLIYYPINRFALNSIRVWLTDQDNNPVDLRGERITVR